MVSGLMKKRVCNICPAIGKHTIRIELGGSQADGRKPKVWSNQTGVKCQGVVWLLSFSGWLRGKGFKGPRASGAQPVTTPQEITLILQVLILPIFWQVRTWVVQETRRQGHLAASYKPWVWLQQLTPRALGWGTHSPHLGYSCTQSFFKSTTAN